MGRFQIANSIATLAVLAWGCCASAQNLDLNSAADDLPTPESRVPLLDLDAFDQDKADQAKAAQAKVGQDQAGQDQAHLDNLLDLDAAAANVGQQQVKKEVLDDVPPPRPNAAADPLDSNDADLSTTTQPVRELVGEPVRRGPIHEAFADPIQQAPLADKVIRKAPPALVDEIPPTIADDSKNMSWIPGYWAWDVQSKGYVWVSGVWRKQPKNRVWVPGRWEEVDGGYQWVSGVWLPTAEDGVIVKKEILPTPPESLEKGPTSPAPSDEHFWIPGTWQRNDAAAYSWRPGYWSRSQKNWVWVPDHYAWDPAGCVFVPGYWDYTWERRGTLYAPCTFDSVVPGERVVYRPTQVIDADQWLLNLWMGPQSNFYYFGDYYDCVNQGYTPWYQYYGSRRNYYDPLYSYYRWQFPTTYGIGLYGYLNRVHTHYGTHASLRPAVRFGRYDQLGSRGYRSLYGDVRGLSSLLNITLYGSGRYGGYRAGFYDDYRNRYGRYDDHRYDRGYGNGYRSRVQNTPQYRNQSSLDRERNRDRDRDRGPDRDRERNRAEVDRNRVQPRPRVESLGPIRRTSQDQPRQSEPYRLRANPGARGNGPLRTEGSVGRPNSVRYQPPTVSRPQRNSERRGNATTTPRAVTRPADRANVQPTRPSVQQRSRVQPRATTSPSRATPSRATPSRATVQPRATTPSRPSVQSRPSPGFSISGMKNSRNAADVQRQRAAMQKLIRDRKGR